MPFGEGGNDEIRMTNDDAPGREVVFISNDVIFGALLAGGSNGKVSAE